MSTKETLCTVFVCHRRRIIAVSCRKKGIEHGSSIEPPVFSYCYEHVSNCQSERGRIGVRDLKDSGCRALSPGRGSSSSSSSPSRATSSFDVYHCSRLSSSESSDAIIARVNVSRPILFSVSACAVSSASSSSSTGPLQGT